MSNTKAREMSVDDQVNSSCLKTSVGDSSNMFSQKQILKNLVVVSISFMVMFTAYLSMANLQTSLNMTGSVGSGSLAILYSAMILSCLFAPPIMIARIGCKWTMPICMIGYIAYMLANFYPTWSLMAPAAVLIGAGGAPLWSAKCTYLTQMGVWYAKHTGKSQHAVINSFFGVFFMIFQTSQIWGNLISSIIFSDRGDNQTVDTSPEVLALCGANFCPTSKNISTAANLERPVESSVYVVCGIYTGCACASALIIIFLLDRIQLDKKDEKKDGLVCTSLLIATLRHLRRSRYQQLLIPITIYSGIEQAFAGADFTRSYITCSLGIWNVGYVMICYGVANAVSSMLCGRLVQNVGHIPFYILAFLVHGSCQIALLLWIPDPDTIIVYYVIAASWGLGDAIITTLTNALYGQLFSDDIEAAFANFRLWNSVGFIVHYAYSDWLCTDIKLYISLVVMCVGMLGYAITEVLLRHHRKELRANDTPERGDSLLAM